MINTENKFLGVLMKCKDDQNNCNLRKVFETAKMSDIDCLPYIKSLVEKDIIMEVDLNTVHVNPIAKSIYQSPIKKAIRLLSKFFLSIVKYIITYILGIVSGLIIAYVAHKFGW